MKKRILLWLLVIVGVFTITGCGSSLSKDVIGTYKQSGVNRYLVLYEGGTCDGYSDKEDFEKTGYAPQKYKWEIKDGIINLTNVLTDSTVGYKYDSKKEELVNVNEREVFVKQK